ncbi:MAG: lytic murein transglycosylase [Pseudomonadota bacterium]
MRFALVALAMALGTTGAQAFAPDVSPRPYVRDASPVMTVQASAPNPRFDSWVRAFRSRALGQGISARTFDAAFQGAQYLPDVIAKDRNQAEFVKPIWEYLDSAVSDKRVRNGKAALRKNRRILADIERRYGVEAEVVVAVWGMESAYGEFRGDTPVISALATLAFDGRRGRFFEQQLVAALRILQAGDISADRMTGSWAGAMGHTQFIPTSYEAFAQDFRGDGRRDIWSDDPTDALASTAAYLARSGWQRGQPWGVEVRLPRGFDYSQAGTRQSVAAWTSAGVRGVDDNAVPNHGEARLLLPAGARGAAFLTFRNFQVIERYNAADAYVIGVGHLSDRITGGPAIQAKWPEGDRGLRFAERQELQRRLTQAGFNTKGADGIIGPNTIRAIKGFQQAEGLVPDGYASFDLLRRLR